MILDQVPVFASLSVEEQTQLWQQGKGQSLATGEVLFYEGNPSDTLYLLLQGECSLRYGQAVQPNTLLDPIATLGGLTHSVKVTAATDCQIICWSMETLWASQAFNLAARQYLAQNLQATQVRLDEVAAAIHYAPNSAQLIPGPFLFEDTTLYFAFCEADNDALAACLPSGLSLLQRPGRKQSPILIGLAKFPNAHPEHNPDAKFAYTETTYFIPVRRGVSWGMFIPHIYPSSGEPILLGREIYGFPKRLGETIFSTNEMTLRVDQQDYLRLMWDGGDAVDEARLVRGLSDWLGIEGRITELAFQAGEVLRKVSRLPAHRRVNGYNWKRILAVDAEHTQPTYVVDQLTRAVFGVLRWYTIAKLNNINMEVCGGPFADANLTLRELYRTQLDMRLSVGTVEVDYLQG